MREIKFRAWDKNRKKMLDRVLAGPGDPCSIVWSEEHGDWVQFDEFCGDIMQYTGLKDKQGKEIYEGDIVRFKIMEGVGAFFTGAIEYGKAEFIVDGTENLSAVIIEEVIGNLYENPDLLEKP